MIEYGQYLIPSNPSNPSIASPRSSTAPLYGHNIHQPTGMTSIISVKMSSNMPQTPVVSRRRPVFEREAWAILLQTKRVHQQQMEMLLDVVWYHWVNLYFERKCVLKLIHRLLESVNSCLPNNPSSTLLIQPRNASWVCCSSPPRRSHERHHIAWVLFLI